MAPADDKPEFGPRISPESGLPIESEEEFLAAVKLGIAEADAGRTIPLEDVLVWVRSWGTDQELSKPTCR